MNRREALRILGLDEDATPQDIKTAYKEVAQILHPDKFSGNRRLQERATEQFKNLQEAYELLNKKGAGAGQSSQASPYAQGGRDGSPLRTAEIEARLAGIAAARVQLVAQRDLMLDERRNGLVIAGVGLIGVVLGRRPGLFAVLAAIGAAAVVWGIVQVVSSQRTIMTLNEHLDGLATERRRLAELLDEAE